MGDGVFISVVHTPSSTRSGVLLLLLACTKQVDVASKAEADRRRSNRELSRTRAHHTTSQIRATPVERSPA